MSRAKNIAKAKRKEKRMSKSFNKVQIDAKSRYKSKRKTGLGWAGPREMKGSKQGQGKGAFGQRREVVGPSKPMSPRDMRERRAARNRKEVAA